MKFRCERDALAEGLTTAGRAATGRTGALPVLSGVRLVLSGDHLQITGTDLDLTIQLGIDVGGERDGGVVLPARLVSDIVRSLPAGKVELDVDDDNVHVSGGRSQFTVRPLSIDDYPKLAAPTTTSAMLPAARLTNYVFAHSKYSSPLGQRNVLSGLVSDQPETNAVPPDPRIAVPAAAPAVEDGQSVGPGP